MDTINTSASLRLSQTYGAPSKPTPKPESIAGTISRASQVSDQVAISRPEKLTKSIERLAAGAVDLPAIEKHQSVRSPQAVPATYTSRGTLSMHTQPGDRNAAATGVAIGRSLDVSA
ncbi:MAG: hypothetical protein KF805_15960 [Phycisphaeraceae bacterium]|nr:hypothetical protein [Phycisphaeraceae bacterium]